MLLKAKNFKATGPDELKMELFKLLPKSGLPKLAQIMTNWLQGEPLPEQLTDTIVAQIYKKGDETQASNYRPTSFLNSVTKIYSAVLKARIERQTGPTSTAHSIWIQKRKKHHRRHTVCQTNHGQGRTRR